MEDRTPVLSVSQLNEYLKMLMDGDRVLSGVFIRGEISNFTIPRSGHLYFTLKDPDGQVRAVMFRSYADRLRFRPEDGMKVIVHGRISVYGPSGQYQLYADEMQPDGAGSLAMQYEQLRRKLESEGLFDTARKKELPAMPKKIGIITSPTGAAIHDLMNILGRRFPCADVILFPSQVQGSEASAELIAGMMFFNLTRLVDVIIIGRGGGSAEDLWAFNDEELARAVADSAIPVISAVGHESDFTICDFCADCRAPTPSAAAELAVPDKTELIQELQSFGFRMRNELSNRIRQEKTRLNLLADAAVMRDPARILDPYRLAVDACAKDLDAAYRTGEQERRTRLSAACAKLNALSPLAVLSRGYTVTAKDGKTVTKAETLREQDRVDVRFQDGTWEMTANQRKE